MSYLNIPASSISTYVPPDNTSLIYEETAGTYKYKKSGGVTGSIGANALPLLGVETDDVPCLVFTSDLEAALQKTIIETSNVTIALSTKASVNYVQEIAKRKVDKTDFLSVFTRTAEQIEALSSGASLDSSAIATLSAGVSANSSAITTLSAGVSANSGSITTLSAGVSANSAAIVSLTSDVAANSSAIGTKVAQSAYNTKMTELESAIGAKVAQSDYNSKVTELETAIGSRVVIAAGSSLVADTEISKLSAYPAYSTVSGAIAEKQTALQVSGAITSALADYSTTAEVNSAIAARVASVYKYINTVANYTDLPASDAEGLEVGHVYHVTSKGGKVVNAEYVWNGTAWEELGSVIDLSDYAQTASVTSSINAASSTLSAAISAASSSLDSSLTAASTTLNTSIGTASSTLSGAIVTASSALNSAIEAESSARVSAISGINGANVYLTGYVAGADDTTVLSATDSVNAAFVSVVSGLNELNNNLGGNSSDMQALDGRVSSAEADIAALQAATVGYDSTTTISGAIVGLSSTLSGSISATSSSLNSSITAVSSTLDTAITTASSTLSGSISATSSSLNSSITAVSSSLNSAIALKADPVNVVVVSAGTDSAPQAVTMAPGNWYVVTTPFSGTLPTAPAAGTYIKVSVVSGGANRIVAPAGGALINGSPRNCALGITPDGIAIDGETYYFMYVNSTIGWSVL